MVDKPADFFAFLPHEPGGGQTLTASGGNALSRLHDEFIGEQRYVSRLAPATLSAYQASFDLLVHLVPATEPSHLTTLSLTQFFRRLETRTRKTGQTERSGVTASTVASHRSRLSRFLTWLEARGEIPRNPLLSMPRPSVEYERRQYLGRQSVERIFAALALSASSRSRFHRTRNLAIFATLLHTGIRRGELLGLRARDVDLERRELWVRPETSKSRRSRAVPINTTLHRGLDDYLAERRRVPLRSEHLFVSESGEVLSLEGLRHLVKAIIRASGTRFHLHQFRHTFAVNFLHQSGDVAKLQQLLGHRDIRMTSSYLRCLPTASMRDGVEALTLDVLL